MNTYFIKFRIFFSLPFLIFHHQLTLIYVQKSSRGVIADITGMTVLTRSDKRNDRVEISPEQLAAASAEAEVRFHADYTTYSNIPCIRINLFIYLF